jgi:proteasome accessory factor B
MAIAKAERLMNLALCLMNTRRPVSKRELRASIEAYHEVTSDDSFNRMFERDKDDLRELGLVIDTVENLDGEFGYLARSDRNRLPDIALDPEEAAALALAAKVWQQARLAEAASGALQKLRAAGVPYEDVNSALEPRIPTPEPAFDAIMLATRERRAVAFDYRKANAVRPEPRLVEPWALECWRGHWYMAGYDRDRGAVRVFRLSRITGRVRTRGTFTAEVPDHVDVRETVARWAGEGATVATARIRLRRGSGYPLRSRAVTTTPVDADWDELDIPYGHGLDAWLAEFGRDVVVLAPEELRNGVLERLRAVAKG